MPIGSDNHMAVAARSARTQSRPKRTLARPIPLSSAGAPAAICIPDSSGSYTCCRRNHGDRTRYMRSITYEVSRIRDQNADYYLNGPSSTHLSNHAIVAPIASPISTPPPVKNTSRPLLPRQTVSALSSASAASFFDRTTQWPEEHRAMSCRRFTREQQKKIVT